MTQRQATRRLHLIDVENLLGCPRPTLEQVRACAARYEEVTNPGDSDLIVVGCNHGAAAAVCFGWPKARLVQRSGPDGADLALVDVVEHERVAERFDSIVIGSGDGIFTESAAHLGARGVRVTAVSTRRALSRRLALAAAEVLPFDLHLPPANEATALEAA